MEFKKNKPRVISAKYFDFWKNWLLVVNLVTVLIGVLIAFAGNSMLFEHHNHGTQDVFFGGHDLPEQSQHLKNWLFGIIGATIAGFHLLIVFITKYAYARKEKWARNAIALGMSSWFVIDTGISIYFDAFYNVYLINIPSFVLIVLPVCFTWTEFSQKNEPI